MPTIMVVKVKVSDLPPGHKVIWAGRSEKLPTDLFVVSAPAQAAFLEEGNCEFTKAILWLVNPNYTLAYMGDHEDCLHCHLYENGGGMVETASYQLLIPAPGESSEETEAFEI